MKSKQSKQIKQPIKLPSIGNKTMGDISKQSQRQKQRPLSSKNIVNDLQKKLFSQLDAYEEKSLTGKMQKGNSKMKSKTNSTISTNSCKQIANSKYSESDSMEKIAQLMPQLYSKIIQSKKYDQPKALKQTFVFTNQDNTSPKQQPSSIQLKKKTQKPVGIHGRNSSRIPSAKSVKQQKQKQPQKQVKDSFDFAQRQIDNIYEQYLKQQGLDMPQTSVTQLKELNVDLGKCQVDIEQLQKNYSNLIKQLSDLCINQIQ